MSIVQADVFETTPVFPPTESPAQHSTPMSTAAAGASESDGPSFSVIEFEQPDASKDKIPAMVSWFLPIVFIHRNCMYEHCFVSCMNMNN